MTAPERRPAARAGRTSARRRRVLRRRLRSVATRSACLSSGGVVVPAMLRATSITWSQRRTNGPGSDRSTSGSMRSQLYRKSTATFLRFLSTPKFSKLHSSTSVRPPSSAVAGSGSLSSRSSRSLHSSSKRRLLSSSSSTPNPGGSPASIGKSLRIRRANACSVPIGAWSRSPSACRADSVGVPRELRAEPSAQLGGRLLGERDRGDLGDRHAGLDEVHDPVDERTRLPGTCARLDEQRVVEVAADPLAIGVVGRCRWSGAPHGVSHRHRSPP